MQCSSIYVIQQPRRIKQLRERVIVMSEKLIKLHQRNKLMVWLLWGTLFLGLVLSVPHIRQTLAISGLPIALLSVILTWRKIGVRYIMYLVSIGLSIITFFFINASSGYSSLLLIFFTLALISIYHNYRPLLLSGLLAIVMTNYFLQTKEFLSTESDINLNGYLIVTLTALIAQSLIGAKMRRKAEASAAESAVAQNRTEEVLGEVKNTVESWVIRSLVCRRMPPIQGKYPVRS